MKYVKQFLIILIICFLGELCRFFIPLPIPASIYGLVFMLVCLMSGTIKLEQVDETATFFTEIMPVLFIPAGVGLLASYHALKPHLLAILLITFVTTVVVMGMTGVVAQQMMKHQKRKEGSQ